MQAVYAGSLAGLPYLEVSLRVTAVGWPRAVWWFIPLVLSQFLLTPRWEREKVVGMSTEIRIEDEGEFKAAVGDVRDDTSDTNWWVSERTNEGTPFEGWGWCTTRPAVAHEYEPLNRRTVRQWDEGMSPLSTCLPVCARSVVHVECS